MKQSKGLSSHEEASGPNLARENRQRTPCTKWSHAKRKEKEKGSDITGQLKKMPLVSGMILGDSRSVPGIKKAKNADKTDMFAK